MLYKADAYDRARVCYNEAYRADIEDSNEGRVRALIGIGNSLLMEQDYFGARDSYHRAMVDAQRGRFQQGTAEALIELSDVERALGNLNVAEAYAKQALSLNISLNRGSGMIRAARSLVNLVQYLDASADLQEARTLLVWATTQLREAAKTDESRRALDVISAAQRELQNSGGANNGKPN
jgi:tetratricopeptide (TPR) repeat protein